MTAGQLDITVEQGIAYTQKLIWEDSLGAPIDNSLYDGLMHIRDSINDPTVDLVLSTAGGFDGTITMGGANGEIDLFIGPIPTATVLFAEGVYDLELTNTMDATDVIRLIEGKVFVTRQVTRP